MVCPRCAGWGGAKCGRRPARIGKSRGEEKRGRRGKETRSKKGGRREEGVEEALTGGQAGARVSPVVRPASHPPPAVVSMPPSRRPFSGVTVRWNSHG